MKAKFVNEFESGYYPMGAEFDSAAPWNEPDVHEDFDVDLDKYGYVTLIKRWYSNRNEGEDTYTIDPEKMDKLIASKLDLDYEQMEEEGEIVEIYSIEEENHSYKFVTNVGDATISSGELEDLI